MAPLPQPLNDPTLDAADRELEARARLEQPRGYLGMSEVGDECARRIWYRYHQPRPAKHNSATLKRFADGHECERIMAVRLRMAPGITLHTVDPETGQQFALSDFGGRVRGHMDGAILGVLEAPKTWHVWEAKSADEKGFGKFLALRSKLGDKATLEAWNKKYWVQAQLYMGYSGMTRHFLTVSTPGVRAWSSTRTNFDQAAFERAKARALSILESPFPLARVSNDPNWWQCKFCEHREVCHT